MLNRADAAWSESPPRAAHTTAVRLETVSRRYGRGESAVAALEHLSLEVTSIGITKALGAEPATVRWIFLVESALAGVAGGVVGLVLAELAGVAGNAIFHLWLRGQGLTDTVSNLSVISVQLIIGALLLAVLVSLLAGAWPSRRAVRLQPLEALRYE